MELTDLQYQIQKYSDKTLQYGCLIKYPQEWDDSVLTFCAIYDDTGDTQTLSYLNPDREMTDEINDFDDSVEIEVLWKPVDWGWICYLYTTRDNDDNPLEWWDRHGYSLRYNLLEYAKQNPIVQTRTVLERPVDLQIIVLDFLKTFEGVEFTADDIDFTKESLPF